MDFEKHSLIFFKNYKYANSELEYDFMHNALDYVKKESEFRYKDDVDAGVLINMLEELKFIKYIRKDNTKRLHRITEKGINFLSENENK